MQRIYSQFLPVLAAVLVSGAALVHAEESKGKVAVLNLQAAVMSTTEAREQIKTLEADKDYAETRKKVESLQKEMEKKIAEAKKESPTWSKEQQSAYQTEMELKGKELQLNRQRMEAAQQALLRQVMKEIQPKLEKVIKEQMVTQKISILLRSDAVFDAAPDADITALVTEKLNAAK